MHSWAVLRKPTPQFLFSFSKFQIIFTQTNYNNDAFELISSSKNASIYGGVRCIYDKSNGDSSDGKNSYSLLTKSMSIIGSTLGICYYSSFLDSESPFIAYADSQGEFAETIGKKVPMFLFGDSYRKKVFFKYEKRIRLQSPPEKVFEYFASFRAPTGEVFMTPADLMHAMVPVFPPYEATHVREGCLKGESFSGELQCDPSEFFMLFDTNNDGLISFAEYIFFVTLLSIPESSFSVAFKMFDLDNNGEIDKGEFKKVMGLMRTQNKHVSRHRDGKRLGLKVSGSVENGGLLEYFFGKDGKSGLEHGRFVKFLKDLHDEILRLEFKHYDYHSKGTISAKNFGLSMVASADMKHIDKFLGIIDDIDNEPCVRDIRITFEEFKNYAELRKRLRPLSMAIFSYGRVNGLLTKPDFQRAAYQVCGISLTDNVVDMIFYVFDANRDGSLSFEEFLRVLQRREGDATLPRETGIMGLISCWLACTKNCSSSKILL